MVNNNCYGSAHECVPWRGCGGDIGACIYCGNIVKEDKMKKKRSVFCYYKDRDGKWRFNTKKRKCFSCGAPVLLHKRVSASLCASCKRTEEDLLAKIKDAKRESNGKSYNKRAGIGEKCDKKSSAIDAIINKLNKENE